jgi:hypothetical protein
MRWIRDFLSGFIKGFRYFGRSLSVTVNSALLLPVYLAGVGITSLFARMVKKSFLGIEAVKKDTYWSDLNLKKRDKESYYRQF